MSTNCHVFSVNTGGGSSHGVASVTWNDIDCLRASVACWGKQHGNAAVRRLVAHCAVYQECDPVLGVMPEHLSRHACDPVLGVMPEHLSRHACV